MPKSYASMARVAVALCCLVLYSRCDSQTWTADNGNGTYSNPLFYDEFSDPDMIRVESDFYLTGTTMHSMPGLPILHSKDLVNWEFLGYAFEKLDLGPEFHLKDGHNAYGQGIWAPCLRYHNGTFFIFSNVNGHTTQLFRATDPRGPWTRTPMQRSLHDLSVLFDDDGKVYVVWGYGSIHLAQLTDDLTDIVPGTEHEIIAPSADMGEGLHFYKIKGKYYIISAWFLDVMRMPVARADRLEGPWEVNQNVSRGEDFGLARGYRLNPEPPGRNTPPPYPIAPPDPSLQGRNALHQGGIVQTPRGEWWGFSMIDANSVGRLTALSPVTWKDGWPYFGLTGNLGRTPRIWMKPDTGVKETPHAPYKRSDDFSSKQLQPIWQWNHIPVDSFWSLSERPGYLRLHSLPANDLWTALNTLTQRAIGPRSIPTVVMDTKGLKVGDIAGLALFNRPYAWIGVEQDRKGLSIVQHDDQTGRTDRLPLTSRRVWLRADCDFMREVAQFGFSTDGEHFQNFGEPFTMVYQGLTFQGVRYALFNYNVNRESGGYADFDSINVSEPSPHGLTRPIPYGKQIELVMHNRQPEMRLASSANSLFASPKLSTTFTVVDRGLGRVALRTPEGFVSVDQSGIVSLRSGILGDSETFQWMETFTGELILLSLETHRYLRFDTDSNRIMADSPGPRPDGKDGARFDWSPI